MGQAMSSHFRPKAAKISGEIIFGRYPTSHCSHCEVFWGPNGLTFTWDGYNTGFLAISLMMADWIPGAFFIFPIAMLVAQWRRKGNTWKHTISLGSRWTK